MTAPTEDELALADRYAQYALEAAANWRPKLELNEVGLVQLCRAYQHLRGAAPPAATPESPLRPADRAQADAALAALTQRHNLDVKLVCSRLLLCAQGYDSPGRFAEDCVEEVAVAIRALIHAPKARLGNWLTAEENRSWYSFPTNSFPRKRETPERDWICVFLIEAAHDGERPVAKSGSGADLGAAIVAALDSWETQNG